MYNYSLVNNTDENGGRQCSQEYPPPIYHEMQPPPFVSVPETMLDSNRVRLNFSLITPLKFDSKS